MSKQKPITPEVPNILGNVKPPEGPKNQSFAEDKFQGQGPVSRLADKDEYLQNLPTPPVVPPKEESNLSFDGIDSITGLKSVKVLTEDELRAEEKRYLEIRARREAMSLAKQDKPHADKVYQVVGLEPTYIYNRRRGEGVVFTIEDYEMLNRKSLEVTHVFDKSHPLYDPANEKTAWQPVSPDFRYPEDE